MIVIKRNSNICDCQITGKVVINIRFDLLNDFCAVAVLFFLRILEEKIGKLGEKTKEGFPRGFGHRTIQGCNGNFAFYMIFQKATEED